MKPTIKFVLITALRDRLFVSLLALLALAFGISTYLGGGAVAEAEQMTVVYSAGAARVLVILGLTVFVAFHIERLYDTREIEAILSRSISRETFVVSYWLAMVCVALLVIVPAIVVISLFQLSPDGTIYWSATILLEGMIMVAFAIFCGMSMERAIPTIFATMGFYILARMVGFFTGIAAHGKQSGMNQVANPIMEYVGYLVPRLDLAGQTRWLVYGVDGSEKFTLIALQGIVYIVLLLSAAIFDLRRKHF